MGIPKDDNDKPIKFILGPEHAIALVGKEDMYGWGNNEDKQLGLKDEKWVS